MYVKAQNKKSYLSTRLLASLGNKKPSQKQINLMNSLFFTANTLSEILFFQNLTDREITCLRLITQGKTAGEIADLLNLKKTTIDSHYKKIKRKTNSKTMPEAVFKGICLGIINMQPLKKYDA